jgi:hypothetical protein
MFIVRFGPDGTPLKVVTFGSSVTHGLRWGETAEKLALSANGTFLYMAGLQFGM